MQFRFDNLVSGKRLIAVAVDFLTVKVPSYCCDLSCNVVASCGRSGIACSWPGVVVGFLCVYGRTILQ